MSILGLDIGGANIKAADSTGRTLSRPFAIWKHPEQLAAQIRSICREFPQVDSLAVTMTAELADCFATKKEGVAFILDQIEAVDGRYPCLVWTTEGRFVSTDTARTQPMLVAAANWHALATWIGRYLAPSSMSSGGRSSLLIDIGTTTTDFIPLLNGVPATIGRTDVDRLQSGELCYSGVKRTPLCAIAYSVPFRDGYCSVAAELFATTLDLYLLLGDVPEDENDLETANSKPATKAAAYQRIARSLCGDCDEITLNESLQIAKFLADVQRQRLAGALERVVQRLPYACESVVISGSGSFLARHLIADNRRLATAKVTSIDDMLSPGIAEAACAYAVAKLSEAVTSSKRAVIDWISAELGGRQSGTPIGPDYAAPAKFLAHADTWLQGAWDLLVHKVECVGGPDKWLADVRFRRDVAPHEWLTAQADFELYEGKRCVARGHIE